MREDDERLQEQFAVLRDLLGPRERCMGHGGNVPHDENSAVLSAALFGMLISFRRVL